MKKRIRVNEKQAGLLLIVLGLGGLWLGFQSLSPNPRACIAAQVHVVESSQAVAAQSNPATTGERQACRVLTVYDGDTLGCDLDQDGQIQKPIEEIRLLGIDSPERSYSRKNKTYRSEHPQDEPYSKEASEWMVANAQGKTVYLEFDLRKQDRYRRTLAFVYLKPEDKTSLNELAVRQGYAKMLFLGKNRRYEGQFMQAEADARSGQRGLWALP